MSKSILVLEENSVVHGLVASALDMDGLTLHHEFNPAKYVERARTLQPDLILFSNADQGNQYAILKQLKTLSGLGNVPLVLLANSRDRVDPAQLKLLKVAGLVRKPFEASDLQQQVSKHLDLIEMIGSAYEYQKSQSVRDEGMNPLAQIDVLDAEVVSLMQDSGKAAPMAEAAVPEVDFTAELRQERPAQARSETRQTAGAATVRPSARDDLDLLDDGPVETFSAGATDALLGEDVLLDESDLVPPLGDLPRADGMAAFEETTLEELGPEDLLDEESYEEASFAPAGIDQTIGRTRTVTSSHARMDEIEVELTSDDLTFPPEDLAAAKPVPAQPMAAKPAPAMRAEARPAAAKPAPAKPAQPAPKAPEPLSEYPDLGTAGEFPRGEIPPAVRRMMELKPVFSKAPDAEALEPDPLSMPAASLQGDDADFALGDDELDEAAILRAMENEERDQLAPLDGADPDLLGLSSSEEIDLEAVEAEADLAPLPAAPEQDDQDLTIDEDEEELILSSLDDEAEPEAAADLGNAPAAVELTQEERTGLTEMLKMEQEVLAEDTFSVTEERTVPAPAMDSAFAEAEAMARADQDEMDLLDELGPTEEVPPVLAAQSEAEQFLNATFQNTPAVPGISVEGGLELPPEELLEVPVPQPESDLPVGGAWEAETEIRTETTVRTATATSEAAGMTESAGAPDSFEDAFAALKEEIETNPQGERLDDVLKMEQLQDEVAKIEFNIPQHEHALARGMPLYAVPQAIASRVAADMKRPARTAAPAPLGSDDSVESMRRIAGETRGESRTQAAASATVSTTVTRETIASVQRGSAAPADELRGLDASGSLLDEATKARLSQVLDEIISVSVRKAVREEMPRLMERMAKEQTSPPART